MRMLLKLKLPFFFVSKLPCIFQKKGATATAVTAIATTATTTAPTTPSTSSTTAKVVLLLLLLLAVVAAAPFDHRSRFTPVRRKIKKTRIVNLEAHTHRLEERTYPVLLCTQH